MVRSGQSGWQLGTLLPFSASGSSSGLDLSEVGVPLRA